MSCWTKFRVKNNFVRPNRLFPSTMFPSMEFSEIAGSLSSSEDSLYKEFTSTSSRRRRDTDVTLAWGGRKRRLHCRNGFYLEVLCDGVVQRTRSKTSPFSIFIIKSVGENSVVLWAIETGLYLALDDNGEITSTVFKNEALTLFEEHDLGFFTRYSLRVNKREGILVKYLSLSKSVVLKSKWHGTTLGPSIQFMTEIV